MADGFVFVRTVVVVNNRKYRWVLGQDSLLGRRKGFCARIMPIAATRTLLLLFVLPVGVDAFVPQETGRGDLKSRLLVDLFSSGDFNAEGQLSRRQILENSFAVAASGLLLPSSAIADNDSFPSPPQVTVPTVQLGGGKSSLRVSRTIQGYWQLAGGHGSYREVDAIENMQAHFDAGVTTLDTADIYGPSELIVGKFVKTKPEAIPCTKFCCFRYLEVSCSRRIRF